MKEVTVKTDGAVREPEAHSIDVVVTHEGFGWVRLLQGTDVVYMSPAQTKAVVEAIEEGD